MSIPAGQLIFLMCLAQPVESPAEFVELYPKEDYNNSVRRSAKDALLVTLVTTKATAAAPTADCHDFRCQNYARRVYNGMHSGVEYVVSNVTRELQAAGLWPNTIFVLTGVCVWQSLIPA